MKKPDKIKQPQFLLFITTLLIALGIGTSSLGTPWPGDSGTLIANSENLGADYEPSDAVWHSRLNKLIIVGDDGDVTIMNSNGGDVTTWHPGGDLEGVTIADPTSNYIYIGVEQPDTIKEFNISTGQLTGKSWDLTPWMTGPSNAGLEALTFVPNGRHPYPNSSSGGLFYAGLQCDGKIYVFDVDLSSSGNVSHIDTITPLPGHIDISGLCYNSTTDTLYAIFDNDNLLVEMATNGTVKAIYTLPGNEQEGIAIVTSYPSTNAQVYITEDTPPRVWCYSNYPITYSSTNSTISITADNAFELYVNGTLIRTGNNWTKTWSYDCNLQEGDVIAIKAMDQGWIAGLLGQIGSTIVTDSSWKCTTTYQAGWNTKGFNDISWSYATEHFSNGSVPWGNISSISSSAKWIWSSDNINHDVVYFRKTITSSTSSTIKVTADNIYTLYVNGTQIGSGNNWQSVQSYIQTLADGDVIAIKGEDQGWIAGLLAEITYNGTPILTNGSWKCSTAYLAGWNTQGFSDSSWSYATEHGSNGSWPWGNISGISSSAKWIWSSDNINHDVVYFRKTITNSTIKLTVDDAYTLYLNGTQIGSSNNWQSVQTYAKTLSEGDVIAVKAIDQGWIAGLLAEITYNGTTILSNNSWKCSTTEQSGWNTKSFDDTSWSQATEHATNGSWPWGNISGITSSAKWIWSSDNISHNTVYFRKIIGNTQPTTDKDIDGIFNAFDAFSENPLEWENTDNGTTGNNADPDDDNDGVLDIDDDFPYNSTKSTAKHTFTIAVSMPTSWDTEHAWNSFLKNITVLDEVNPFWYEMQSDGTLTAYEGAKDTKLINLAHDNDVIVIPYICNQFDPIRVNAVINNYDKTISHIQNIVNEVVTQGYDGINIDYESCYANDRDAFTRFIKNLAAALHNNGKILSISIHAKTYEPGDWAGAINQDWEALAGVVDKFRVMSYAYSWETSPAGPIAPMYWLEEVTDFALTLVDPKKLIMGIPFYGYDWVGSNGDGKTWLEVQDLIDSYNITPNWNNSAQEPYFEYYDGSNYHTVYYEDHQSTLYKLDSFINYNAKGISIWRIGGEDPQNWDVIKEKSTYSPYTKGALQTYIEIIETFIPGEDSEIYTNPSAIEKSYFQDIIDYIFNQQFSLARDLAEQINYELVEFFNKSNSQIYYILRENIPITKGWGTYIFNLGSQKDLIIEVPHPLYESGTSRIGIETFLKTDAKAFLLAGTHRYANSDTSSDVAHNADSIFELVHEHISTAYSKIIQIHGFSIEKHPGYPDVVLSNGTSDPLPEFSQIKDTLETYGISVGIYDGTNYSDLGATTNVQGQYINSIDAKFCHIELCNTLRDDSAKLNNLTGVLKDIIGSKNLVVSCLGDSVTNGYPYAGTENTYPAKLKVMLETAYSESFDSINIINRGVNGYRADQVLDNLTTYLNDNPDYVLLMVGGNDLGQEVLPDKSNFFEVVNQTVAEVQAIIDGVTTHTNPDGLHPKIIVSTFIPVQDYWATVGLKIYNEALKNNLTGMDLLITSNWDNFYDSSTKQAYTSLMADSVHPNANGYSIMADNWFGAIDSLGPTSTVKNVILFIGDGMGSGHVKAGKIFAVGPNGLLNMETLSESGEVTTSSLSGVTDSAAAATAMATGYKVYNGYLSQSQDGKEYKTILEYAKILGKRTGLVTTTEMTHATPAGFGTHTNNRDNWDEIAHDYLNGSEPNILFGGGKKYWIPSNEPGSVRSDNGLIDDAQTKGYIYVDTSEELSSLMMDNEDKVLGLFSLSHMTYEYEKTSDSDEPALSLMVEKALDLLEEDPDGFFLMVEGGRIDHASHANDITNVVYETNEFDNAVATALAWIISHPDTLLIITADHETGGLQVSAGGYSAGQIPDVTWTTGGHTGTNVPIRGKGPGSASISATLDNIDLFDIILNAIKKKI